MSIFEQLSTNKGTVSNMPRKTLAPKVLHEDREDILLGCLEICIRPDRIVTANLLIADNIHFEKTTQQGARQILRSSSLTNFGKNLILCSIGVRK